MTNYCVYILYSERFDKYYIGQTNSLEHRLVRHNEFDLVNTYTAKYRPWTLKAWVEIGNNRGDAMKVERRLKSLKSKKMIAEFAENPEKLTEFAAKVLSPNSPSH
jgi:putative endonuclease